MTRSSDPEATPRSIGAILIQDAAEPIEHMTETYDPEEEESDGFKDDSSR
jgi:hypothetical protein